jgi:hypothetical protein
MMTFPTEWKVIKFMFQTTNQLFNQGLPNNLPRRKSQPVFAGESTNPTRNDTVDSHRREETQLMHIT